MTRPHANTSIPTSSLDSSSRSSQSEVTKLKFVAICVLRSRLWSTDQAQRMNWRHSQCQCMTWGIRILRVSFWISLPLKIASQIWRPELSHQFREIRFYVFHLISRFCCVGVIIIIIIVITWLAKWNRNWKPSCLRNLCSVNQCLASENCTDMLGISDCRELPSWISESSVQIKMDPIAQAALLANVLKFKFHFVDIHSLKKKTHFLQNAKMEA